MGDIADSFLPNNGKRDDTQIPLAPVPDALAKIFRDLPSYGEPNDEARDYLRDNIELGLEHLAGACSAWGSGAYFPCEASCRTVFEISVNILYMLQAPEQRVSQHQRAGLDPNSDQYRVLDSVNDAREVGRTFEISYPWKCKLTEGWETCSKALPR